MKYVQIERTDTGYWLDPTDYLDRLNALARDLPVGAAAFATDPDHYDFRGGRCVKDLRVASVAVREQGGSRLGAEIVLGANKWKHDVDLVIRYEGVSRLDLRADPVRGDIQVWPESRRLGDLQLDEILPLPDGCSHEIKLTGGRIFVECVDLHAEWVSPVASEGDG